MNYKTFAEALRSEILKAGFTYKETSEMCGLFHTAISNIIQRNSVSEENYNKLLTIFPALQNSPMPKNLKFKNKPSPSSKSKNSFSNALRDCIDSYNLSKDDIAQRVGLSAKGFGRVLRSNRTSIETYKKLLDIFPELKHARKPSGLKRLGLRHGNYRRIVTAKKFHPTSKPQNIRTEDNISKFIDSDVDEFNMATILIKIGKSNISRDLKYVLQMMKKKNISIDKLIDLL